jgi:voltage-dependent anion channel protein 2
VRYKCKFNDKKSSISFQYAKKLTSRRSKTGRFKSSFAHERVRLDGDVNVDLAGPLINASAVVDYQGWLAGYQLAFDSQKSKLTGNNFALGYTTGDFVLHTNV